MTVGGNSVLVAVGTNVFVGSSGVLVGNGRVLVSGGNVGVFSLVGYWLAYWYGWECL
jgi:hypothetical protein